MVIRYSILVVVAIFAVVGLGSALPGGAQIALVFLAPAPLVWLWDRRQTAPGRPGAGPLSAAATGAEVAPRDTEPIPADSALDRPPPSFLRGAAGKAGDAPLRPPDGASLDGGAPLGPAPGTVEAPTETEPIRREAGETARPAPNPRTHGPDSTDPPPEAARTDPPPAPATPGNNDTSTAPGAPPSPATTDADRPTAGPPPTEAGSARAIPPPPLPTANDADTPLAAPHPAPTGPGRPEHQSAAPEIPPVGERPPEPVPPAGPPPEAGRDRATPESATPPEVTTPEALSPSTPRAAPPPAETGADGPLAASGPGAPDRAAAPAEAGGAGPPEALPPGWVPPGASVTVAGRQIGGMVYIGTPPKRGARGAPEASRALIDPALPVAAQGADTAGAALPYWPGYAQIPPRCRAAYLDWLATGRSDATYDPGYLFLYFYGLERRFFCDDPPQAERQALLQEVRRLARLHPENRSVQGYLGAFIDVAEILLTDPAESAPRFGPPGWSLPLSLTLGLGLRVREGHPLSADWLLSWLMSDPEHRLRTPATRCFPEFRALFGLLFAERHPEGLLVRPPRAVLSVTYRAASGEFSRDLTPEPQGRPVPDVSGLRRPLSVAVEIADAACAALDRYSRQIGRDPEGRASMAAQTLLPMPLWPLFPMPQMDALRDWAAEIVGQGGLVLASEVVARLEGARPERISKRRLIAASDALARLGYGLAPDPRFALRAPTSREAVVLFDLGGPVERLEETVSEAYRAALMQIALASFVAHADGALVEAERAALTEQVLSAEGLSAAERRRLRANVTWFLAVPPDLALLRRRLKESGAEDHPQFRAAIIAAAHADGVIHPGEVAGIEKLYSALGMDPSRAYADLHAGAEAGPLRMRAAQDATPGEPIPEETAPAPGPAALDAARLAAIRAETERVSSVLGRIFAEAEAEAEEPAAPTAAQAPPGADTALPGLDARHSALLRALLQRPHWPEPEFAALCAQYGLMAEGALETINEWAFEAHDAALLEEDGGYEVSPEVSAAITTTIGEESPHDQRDQTETA